MHSGREVKVETRSAQGAAETKADEFMAEGRVGGRTEAVRRGVGTLLLGWDGPAVARERDVGFDKKSGDREMGGRHGMSDNWWTAECA